jgi:peptidoglycan/xylan/chitin deacetylase (PgdA/CDA1 family)
MKRIYLPVLMYHIITEQETGYNYSICAKSFEKQMQYLCQNGFKTVVPEEISRLNETNDTKLIMITFDDGYETDYTLALPILRKYGFKGVSFVTTGFLGNKGHMNWEQAQKLLEEGFSIQSHTRSHLLLKSASDQSIREEVYLSKQSIEVKLKSKVIGLSLPGGSYSKKVRNIAIEQGYRYIFNSKPDINIINGSIVDTFGRIPVTHTTSLEKFVQIVNLDKKTFRHAKISYAIKDTIRVCIGPQNYHRLWNKYAKNGDKKWL